MRLEGMPAHGEAARDSDAPLPETPSPRKSFETWEVHIDPAPALELGAFRTLVWEHGLEHYRDLPWRRTRDPYAVWISEVMLQQTQVTRVDGRWQRWLERFPSVEALAAAHTADVLDEWQGMGYNRRALSLHRAANQIARSGEGFPREERELTALPGIGPATAAGIRAFAFDLPGVYLETNVRTVFLHALYPRDTDVPDKWLAPLVRAACPQANARGWYFALLDYGAWLKRTVPNPSRRSRSHVRQTSFEGSHRQKRAEVVRLLLQARPKGVSAKDVARALTRVEKQAGRPEVSEDYAHDLLRELSAEGFCSEDTAGRWRA